MADTVHEPRLITETGIDQRIAEIIEPVLTGMGYLLVRVRLSNQNGMTLAGDGRAGRRHHDRRGLRSRVNGDFTGS